MNIEIHRDDYGYVSKDVADIIEMIKEGSIFLETYCEKFIKDGNTKIDLIGNLCEAKTYFNLELKKQFPRTADGKDAYNRFARYTGLIAEYIEILDKRINKYYIDNLDDQLKKLQNN